MYVCIYIYIYIHTYIYIYIYIYVRSASERAKAGGLRDSRLLMYFPYRIVAIFYPFSQFCEIDISLLSLQKQPKTASNLFQRGV